MSSPGTSSSNRKPQHSSAASKSSNHPNNNSSHHHHQSNKNLEAALMGRDQLLATAAGLPQFLRKKIGFRDATHSESLKGLVVTGGSAASAANTSVYASYKLHQKRPANDYKASEPTAAVASLDSFDRTRDEKYGFKLGSTDIFPKSRLIAYLQWSKIRSIGPGFSNLGNTCFLNSVLQCLVYSTSLTEFLLAREHSRRCHRNSKEEFCGLCAMERLAGQCFPAAGRAEACVRPVEFVARIKAISKHFRPGRQEDAHEFLRYLVESMQKSSLPQQGNSNNSTSLGSLDMRSKETTPINRIFGGYLQSTVTCSQCKHVSRTFDHFLDLSLDINKSESLEAAFKTFTRPDFLTKGNRYQCEACRKLVDAHKQLTIYKTPEILTLQLKRFSANPTTGQASKLNRPIVFGEHLDVSGAVSTGDHREGTKYRLYAVVVHEGHSCNSGHYHAFVKNSTGVWYSMNDSSVHQVSLETVLRQRAYILFYQKIHGAAASKSDQSDVPIVQDVDRPKTMEKARRSKEEKMTSILQASRAYTSQMRNESTDDPIESVDTSTTSPEEQIPQLIDVCMHLRSNSMWHMIPYDSAAAKQTPTPNINKRARFILENNWKVSKHCPSDSSLKKQ